MNVGGTSLAPGAGVPLYFGEGGRMFGWWHAPVSDVRGAVVLCEPVGCETMWVHWAFRRLAEALALCGFGVVRFDCVGTGDSAGARPGEQEVDAWRRSVDEAAAAAREWSGSSAVAYVGLRLGATLAALSAVARQDARAVVLMEPVVQGRAWLREQKALASTSGITDDSGRTQPRTDGSLEVLGYVYGKSTVDALGKLDLVKLPAKPAAEVLYLHRADRPVSEPLLAALEKLGARVTRRESHGLAPLLQDSTFSKEPTEDFAAVQAWLVERFAPQPGVVAAGPQHPAMQVDSEGYREEVALLGGARRLTAVLCAPKGATERRPTLVILNTGANHRVGLHETSVQLARRLAREGFASLRFDLAGVGDSPAQPGQVQNFPYHPGNVDDVRTALDWLAARGHQRFVVTGICSGGSNAFHGAVADARVVGAVITNTQRFIWREGDVLEVTQTQSVKSYDHYREMLFDPDTWKRLVKGDVQVRALAPALAKKVLTRTLRSAEVRLTRVLGARAERDPVARGFLQLCERKAPIYLVLSGRDGARDELATHLGADLALLRGKPNVHVDILEGADHTLTFEWARDRMFEAVRACLLDVE
ncbi:MAG: alpha/beta hydrolase [Archangiaceae bacterium]|nr:alpha/beta hydrolase [Archangiaceae bacterium]